jgi:phosphoserine aminotransferase
MKGKGIDEIEADNNTKAKLLYDEIDRNKLFKGTVINKPDRSKMNVCFLAKDGDAETDFLRLCNENNIMGIAGHRSVGGFRASLYNAITIADVEKLVSLMQEFENHYQ